MLDKQGKQAYIINKFNANTKQGDNKMEKLMKGDKVKTIYGRIETVMKDDGIRVHTYESKNAWFHPTKVWKIVKS